MNDATDTTAPIGDDGYEAPELRDFGTIEEWTQGSFAQIIQISVII